MKLDQQQNYNKYKSQILEINIIIATKMDLIVIELRLSLLKTSI